MNMRIFRAVVVILILFIPAGYVRALDVSDPYIYISGLLEGLIDENEGQTAFRSLLIPGGGRAEAMGSAFTALANDISFFETNPAGSATMKNTELAVFHNNWIADSRLETLSFTTRKDVLGYGLSLRCFYLPFTEYNTFGERASRGYYTETFATFNVAYNFFSGYYFKGVAVGANLKTGFRGMPDYSDNEGNRIEGSGLSQSALAIMTDIGAQTQFNFAKLYNSRDPNFSVGATIRNLGPPTSQGEALPTVATFGIGYKFANPAVVTLEIQKPLNLLDLSKSENMIYAAGFSVDFLKAFTFLAGFQLKGANPRISIGGEMNVNDLQFNVNYTLDMTTQAALFNRISLAAKLNLGDRGREKLRFRIEELYIEGLQKYASGNLVEAIEIWQEVLELDSRFDPAREGITTASLTLELQNEIREFQQLD